MFLGSITSLFIVCDCFLMDCPGCFIHFNQCILSNRDPELDKAVVTESRYNIAYIFYRTFFPFYKALIMYIYTSGGQTF